MGDLTTQPTVSEVIRVEWEKGEGRGRNASHWAGCLQQCDPPPPALGRGRGSAGKIKGPRKVGQGSSSSKRLERTPSFKMLPNMTKTDKELPRRYGKKANHPCFTRYTYTEIGHPRTEWGYHSYIMKHQRATGDYQSTH